MTIGGVGAVTGYGWGREALWGGLLSGKPAASVRHGYGPHRDQDAWVAQIPEVGECAEAGGELAAPRGESRYGRAAHESVREAILDARSRGWRPGRRVGLLHAIVLGDVANWRDFYLLDGGNRRSRGYLPLLPSTPISVVLQEFGFHGPTMNVSAACSSANVAMITARLWLDAGVADDVICVASDLSATPDMVEHFVNMGAAVTDAEPLDACRPFQEGSRGFSMGEGSVAFVLSRAVERPYASVLGGAMTNDGFHVVSVEPSHEHIFDCVRLGLDDAGVVPEQVRYFNAHGTGTKQCDDAERDVLGRMFDDRPRISSVKPLVGHCQGAAAAVEVAASALAYDRGVVASAPIVARAHPGLLDGTAAFDGGVTVKLSLGMGGNNSVVVLGPP
ncbi:beta-ketoacyl synthase N-terminal-like domain-containing protein [Nocardia callitridis]|uniref:Beta-ketoacyl-[acyl-carrier-protein] synthase family protein n=1 Tax=Nocardia callitridis TaxID=648753 RepID=A0ABP9KLV2_9NOCA